MLGESNLPHPFPSDPEHRDITDDPETIEQRRFDWPNDLINRIKHVMSLSCDTPSPPAFKFEMTKEATMHNLKVLEQHGFSLDKALDAQRDSPLGPGKEFRPPDILRSVFGQHPLWN